MPDSELKTWFDENWFLYPSDLSHNKKGAKPPALKAAEKIYKTSGIAELNRITENIKALIRHDKKELKAGGRPDRWPHFSTFLNQGYYDREIPSYSEKTIEKRLCNCGGPSVIGDKCVKCYEGDKPQWKIEMYERLKKMGLQKLPDESKHDYAMRCRDYARANFTLPRQLR